MNNTSPDHDPWTEIQDYLPECSSLEGFHQKRTKFIESLSQKCQEFLKVWLQIGNKNPWISEAVDPPFTELSFHFCADERELAERILQGNWCLGQAFILPPRDEGAAENEDYLCFINQVNGGDEWLTIKANTCFESITMQTFDETREQAEERLKRTIERIQKATAEQCRDLKY